MKKNVFATIVALVLVGCMFSVTASAASRNYSDWFDLDRINAVDVEEDLTDEASREEVALLLAYLCDEHELLPSKALMDFDDEDDFDSSKSYKLVTRLSSTGIVYGYPSGDFGPEDDITRAEALTMVIRTVDYLGIETEAYRKSGSSFTDTEGHWAEVYVERAYNQGLVSGRGNGRFYPDEEITREEIITILVNLMGESNNPLVAAIDEIYDLEFDNSYNDDDDYDDDNRSSSSRNKRPERPVVSVDDDDDDDENATSNGSRPKRPVVDTTNSSSSTSVERPTVDDETESSSSSRPTRPTV